MVTVCMEMLEYDEDYDMELVGDFTTLTLLEVCQQKGGNFADRAKAIQQRLTEDLEHSTYSAVEFERELKKRTGDMQGVIMPVVFTSGLGIEQWNEGKWLGKLTYNISQIVNVGASVETPDKKEDTHEEEIEKPIVKEIMKIWKEVFEIEDISIQDDFYTLGGDSIILMRLVDEMCKTLGCDVTVDDILQSENISDLANRV